MKTLSYRNYYTVISVKKGIIIFEIILKYHETQFIVAPNKAMLELFLVLVFIKPVKSLNRNHESLYIFKNYLILISCFITWIWIEKEMSAF